MTSACAFSSGVVQNANARRVAPRTRALTSPTCSEVEMATGCLCAISDCGKPARKRGWCPMHYAKWRRYGDPLGGKSAAATGEPVEWLEAHACHAGDECLTWPFSRNQYGYGRVYFAGRFTTASRAMCELAHGSPPSPSYQAAHSCGMGHMGCVNPQHLRWATRAENTADTLLHGTRNRGERNGASKLTMADVARIRALAGDLPQADIGRMFGVHVETVGRIVRGARWGWLR